MDAERQAQLVETLVKIVSLPVATHAASLCSAEVAAKINAAKPHERCGTIQLELDEPGVRGYAICVQLAKVPRDYEAIIDIPNMKYKRDLFNHYDIIKQAAAAFWAHFCAQNPELTAAIKSDRPDLDWNLVVDPKSPTTMYFDPASAERIGVLPYYIDPAGRPLVKR